MVLWSFVAIPHRGSPYSKLPFCITISESLCKYRLLRLVGVDDAEEVIGDLGYRSRVDLYEGSTPKIQESPPDLFSPGHTPKIASQHRLLRRVVVDDDEG